MSFSRLSPLQVNEFRMLGYTLVRGMFEPDEVELLKKSAKEDNDLDKRSFGRADGEGGKVRLSLWNHPGDGIYGVFARCERVVRSMELVLEGEVYHYHSKMIMKDARIGGAWAWHQDYGYWYQNGCLYPHMASLFIAVDPCTRENGCLQVIPGSHECGRIDHVLTGDQAGAGNGTIGKTPPGICRNAARGWSLFSWKPASSVRPESLGSPPLVDDLLLQCGTKQPLQGITSSTLYSP